MEMGGVIDDKIQDYPHATLMTCCDEVVHIADSAVWRVRRLVVRDVVPHIILWTIAHGAYPDGINSQRVDVI